MHIWFSAEVEQGCQSSLKATEAHVEAELRNEMESGKLAAIDLEVCYIPIVMGVDFADLYPARSSYSKTDNRVYHSPHLNCDLFRSGTREERERAYLNGLLLAKPWLEKAGLTDAQLDEFEVKVKRLLAETPL